MSSTLAQFKTAVVDQGLEDQFLKITGLTSLDELSPDNFRDMYGRADSLTKQIGVPLAAPDKAKPADKKEADAAPAAKYEEASDYLYAFKAVQVRYPPRRQPSLWLPNATGLFLITHILNSILVDHFYFLRAAPDFHPGLLRIYLGICFIIQTLRAQNAANELTDRTQYEFLKRILDAFPAETLAIPAPVLHIFKALCASQPEIPQYGLVSPYIPQTVGVARLSNGPASNIHAIYLPDIAGMLSLLNMQSTSTDRKKNFHPDFSTTADTTFRGQAFAARHADWTDIQAWSLRYPGIEHPFESGKKLNTDFFDERYEDLNLPAVTGNTSTGSIDQWCFMTGNLNWFSKLRDIASVACKFLPGSGTLADCPPIGLPIGQIQSHLVAPDTLPTKPTGFTKSSSYNMDIEFQLETTSRSIPQLAMIMAAAAQVHVRYYATHPQFGGSKSRHTGPFWDIRPIEKSSTEDNLFFGMADSIKKAIKDKA